MNIRTLASRLWITGPYEVRLGPTSKPERRESKKACKGYGIDGPG